MPSVSPELPPHLAKRKRSIDEDEDPKSPPRKVVAATAPRAVGPSLPTQAAGPTLPPSKNPDGLNVEDSSDDDYGPSLGPSKPSTKAPSPPPKRVLGPTPPPTTNPDELNLDDDDSSDDGYGPSVPTSEPKSAAPKRVLGPALPPAPLSERPSHPANPDDSSSDSDSDYGPSLPPAPGSAAETALLQQKQQEAAHASSLAQAGPPKPQRDDWMLVPPSDSDWSTRVDPTKLKNRKFASGKGAKAPAEKSGISAIWTETPEQKRQRLADEVLGRSSSSSSSKMASSKQPRSEEEVATERRIREYNERNRGKSLLDVRRDEQERGRVEKEEEDDPSKRGFDREKDMALGGRMGHVKKKEMLERAADFGTRFQRGKYL
ncbi:uncharacterized protein LY89DRAFT_679461 [Mollisia scopiformis]|uniref:DUF3752 domain-containing protein n=1 Tax=Mollisia scopiformis TaxID=149040 RepID=A0A194XVP2_MOLSC|nr:uncharacterized protein LY89DRAFT_679461 [Mollisia scopiformis]KUJ24298.1 hypothetical protein LY89DRAFT_679461 [Mollisia scopiformis]